MESILLIDDDAAFCGAIRLALERAGYSVIVAHDGREGMRLFRRLHPDLVITDILMEGQEGLETIQALRHETPGVKIIAISGGGSSPSCTFLDAARLLGAQQTLDKPFVIQDLLIAMREVLHPEEKPR